MPAAELRDARKQLMQKHHARRLPNAGRPPNGNCESLAIKGRI
jgi:hypothetical protein